MCRPIRVLAVACVFFTSVPRIAGAQCTTERLHSATLAAIARSDSLRGVLDALSRSQLDSTTAELTDTVQVGPLRIFAAHSRVSLAKAAAQLTLGSLLPVIRDTIQVLGRDLVLAARATM